MPTATRCSRRLVDRRAVAGRARVRSADARRPEAAAPSRGGSSVSGSTGGGGSGGPLAPGVTADSINIGLLYTVNGGAANAAIGAKGITQGDQKANDQILIDDINAHGGVLGHKLVPVFHALDATDPSTTDAKFQAPCDDLTQDHKIFVSFSGGNDALLQC